MEQTSFRLDVLSMDIGSKLRCLTFHHRSQQDYGAIQEFRGHLYQIFWSKGLSVGDSKARSIGIVDILLVVIIVSSDMEQTSIRRGL